MGNTFGDTSAQYPLVDPRCVREHRERFRRESVPELMYANSYYSVAGRWPDVGWVLLDRAAYDKVSRYSTSLQLNLQDFVPGRPKLTISNLSIVQARCVTHGIASDPSAIYLLELTNNQGVLSNPWFSHPTNSQYNVCACVYDTFYDWSMNAGLPWTWDEMLENLWEQAPSLLGTYPGLPTAPSGTPEDWIFVGVPLWSAICRVLDHLGLFVAGEFPAYTIVVPGAADAAFTALQVKYGSMSSPDCCLEDDMEYIDGGSGRVPGEVVVYFHRMSQPGTEETIRADSYNWQATPAYSVTVAAPATFTQAAGRAYLWDDFTVRYDMDGAPFAADVTAAATIAAERVQQFYDTIFRGTAGFMRQVYGGLVPFTTGSLVDGVRWYNTPGSTARDYRQDGERDYCGWRTEIVRGYTWDEAMFDTSSRGR